VLADFQSFNSPGGSRRKDNSRSDNSSLNSDDSRPSSSSSTLRSNYSLEKSLPDPPYHVFSRAQKKNIVYIISLAGLFSPLSSNIYFLALGQISRVRMTFESLFGR